MKLRLLATAALALSLAPAALAQDRSSSAALEAQRAAVNAACKGDLDKLCGKAEGEARWACLRESRDKLSEPCKAAREEFAKARTAAFQAACGADMQKHCASVPQGRGELRRCIESNQDKLSAQCKDQVASMRAAFSQGRGGQGQGETRRQ